MHKSLVSAVTAASLLLGCHSFSPRSRPFSEPVPLEERAELAGCQTCIEDTSLLGPLVTPFYVRCQQHDRYSLAGWYYVDVDNAVVIVHYGQDVVLDSSPRGGYLSVYVFEESNVEFIRCFFGVGLRKKQVGYIRLPWQERFRMDVIPDTRLSEQ